MRRLREELQRSLFPPSRETRRLSGWEAAVPVVAFLILASVLQLLRLDPAESLNTLWAEDAPVFLQGARTSGLDAVTTPYAGYLVVVQRLIGELGNLVPLWDAAVVMAIGATLVVGLTGLVVWFASAGHIRSPYLRALLVALTVLSPVAGLEAVVSGTFVGWYMAFGAFWLLLWRPKATWSACLGGAFILFAGLSSPILFFFVPLAVLRAIAIENRRDAVIVGAFALFLAIQLPVTALSKQVENDSQWSEEIWTIFLQRVVDGTVLGLELGGEAWESWGWPFLIGVSVLLALYLAVLAYKARSGRLFALVAVLTSVGMFMASVYERGIASILLWPEGIDHILGTRYAIVPSLLLISAAFVFLDRLVESSRAWRAGAAATAAVLLLALVTSFHTGERGGPRWRDALEAGAVECRRDRVADGIVYVAPPGWGMSVPCDQLEDAVSRASDAPG